MSAYSAVYQSSVLGVCGNIYVRRVWILCTSNMLQSENKGMVSDSVSLCVC